MKALFWLILSGGLWLVLVQLAGRLGLPPQFISLARSGYIGTFSIFMLLELRRGEISTGGQFRPKALYLYLTPLLSLVVLALYSPDLKLTPYLVALMIVFYACQLMMLVVRSERGQIRSAIWDLLGPVLLLLLALHPIGLVVAGIGVAGFTVLLLRRPAEPGDARVEIDTVVLQLPSICIAPVVLIALRDVFDARELVDRAHVETFGLIVNGVGAALWTATVMRQSKALRQWSLVLWGASAIGAVLVAILGVGLIGSALAIIVAEGFRGALWLGVTHLLSRMQRWQGFTFNLIATALPLVALWVGTEFMPQRLLLLLYAAFVLPVPLYAWFNRKATVNNLAPA
ncbi:MULTISPECIES: hypothetical protein [Sphingomonas]|uniref:hypothetical protein n=1 Tax=Sphingomonas TaxID=13687 RepID=UPI00082C2F62|nr:hypothetical protein [Sphingomonas sp. CCH10-B3]